MAYRDTEETGDETLRGLADRVRRLESRAWLSGTVSVGALRIGGFVIEVNGSTGDLQVRRLSDNATTLIMAD